MKQYSHRRAIPKKDQEGSSYIEYGQPSSFEAEVWPGGGKLQAEMYGQRISNIKNVRIDGNYELLISNEGKELYQFADMTVCEGDGICLYVPQDHEPDYRIIAIRPYRYLTLEVEKL
ncbi:hypothetical protein [Clostridium sp. AM58-1XD]|uniref:hypothetical protein n=1 Tax=Clostridium sp. AM58-1XD TaxID=2292307 RepID=UPI001FA91245|nr:hypothetical protein [Clostridium sp. AM58-1XD]